jgi:hypothetical protein
MFTSNILQGFWVSLKSQKPTYATTIATSSQATLQVAIAHHGTVPNNPDPVPTLVNLFLQQLIVATSNIPPTIDAAAFADPVGEFFQVLELEFLVKSSEKNSTIRYFLSTKGGNPKDAL